MTRAILATALLAGASWATADEIWLKGGGRIVGEVLERHPDSVVVDVGPGTVKLPMSRVDRIVGSSSSLAEYRSRAGRLGANDVAGWVALAAWAEQNDLRTQARGAWQHVLTLEPGNAAAHHGLGHVMQAGSWMDPADAMRARGLVEFEGQWMSPVERESRIRLEVAEAAAQRENAIADARVAEAEARAREAEARARTAETDAARADDYSDDGGIPLGIAYGGVGYGGGFGVQPCCGQVHAPGACPNRPRRHDPPATAQPTPPPQRDGNPQPKAKPAERSVGHKPRG